jgi:hypothetical protein
MVGEVVYDYRAKSSAAALTCTDGRDHENNLNNLSKNACMQVHGCAYRPLAGNAAVEVHNGGICGRID